MFINASKCLFYIYRFHFSSVQSLLCPILCDPMNRSKPGLPVHHQLLEFTQTHAHRVHDAIQPSHPLSSPSPPAPNPSQHQSLFNELTLRMRGPKYWSFSSSIIPSKEIRGLISFRMDWLDPKWLQWWILLNIKKKLILILFKLFFTKSQKRECSLNLQGRHYHGAKARKGHSRKGATSQHSWWI